jgi:hypothetical protein
MKLIKKEEEENIPQKRWQKGEWAVAATWGIAAAVTLYMGAAAAVRHDGKDLPPWPTADAPHTDVAHGSNVSRCPHAAPDRWQSLNRRGPRR